MTTRIGTLTFVAATTLALTGAAQEKFYFVGNGFAPDAIQRADPDGGNLETVIRGLFFPQDTAVDLRGGKVYWTDFGSVRRANLDGSGGEVIFDLGDASTRGLAIDHLNRKIYFTDYRNAVIGRANLDGSNVENLVTTGLWIPNHIALDVAGGKMYWTDLNDQEVQRANLDGTEVETLHSAGAYGIAVDPENDHLYWNTLNLIYRSRLDGSEPELVLTTVGTLRGMAIDTVGEKIYWAGLNPARIQRANLDGTEKEVLVTSLDTPLGIDFAHGCAEPVAYCTAGISANGCTATLASTGVPSASAAAGFLIRASGVEGDKSGLFYTGTGGRQANPWGNGTSFQCVVPPVRRAGLLMGSGTNGACDGAFTQDLNARWTTKPASNPGAGTTVQAQLWYRDPANTSNRTTSLSSALEFDVCP